MIGGGHSHIYILGIEKALTIQQNIYKTVVMYPMPHSSLIFGLPPRPTQKAPFIDGFVRAYLANVVRGAIDHSVLIGDFCKEFLPISHHSSNEVFPWEDYPSVKPITYCLLFSDLSSPNPPSEGDEVNGFCLAGKEHGVLVVLAAGMRLSEQTIRFVLPPDLLSVSCGYSTFYDLTSFFEQVQPPTEVGSYLCNQLVELFEMYNLAHPPMWSQQLWEKALAGRTSYSQQLLDATSRLVNSSVSTELASKWLSQPKHISYSPESKQIITQLIPIESPKQPRVVLTSSPTGLSLDLVFGTKSAISKLLKGVQKHKIGLCKLLKEEILLGEVEVVVLVSNDPKGLVNSVERVLKVEPTIESLKMVEELLLWVLNSLKRQSLVIAFRKTYEPTELLLLDTKLADQLSHAFSAFHELSNLVYL